MRPDPRLRPGNGHLTPEDFGPSKGRSLRARRTVGTVQTFSESVRCGHAIPRAITSSLVMMNITSRDEFIIIHDEL